MSTRLYGETTHRVFRVSLIALFLALLLFAPYANAGTATFVNTDKTTHGNWIGVYGGDGYDIASGPQYPANGALPYGSYAVQNQSNWSWASSSADPRALETDSVGDRIATTWYSASSFSLDVNFTDGQQHEVALYLLDWDSQGRVETIDVNDFSSGTTLDFRNIPNANTDTVGSNFVNGTYLIWSIAGHVTITITSNAGPNCVAAGVFFGGKNIAPAAPTATFSGADTSTQGSWLGKYGAEGYWVATAGQSIPSYDPTLAVNSSHTWTWATTTSDVRAPETGTGGAASRTAATWWRAAPFSFDVNIIDGNTHQVSLYMLDWDSQGRAQTIQILDANSNKVLDARVLPDSSGDATNTNTTSSDFVNGTYLTWSISGHVTILITPNGTPNAVVAGIFFGGGGAPPTLATAQWVTADAGTQGTWIGKYGSQGYSLASAGQSISIPATLSIQNQQNWTWDTTPNPPDLRDLETDSHGDTIAAAWYSPGTFTFNLNLTDGATHKVALYVLDWDMKGRIETVKIVDTNGSLLDTRVIPDSNAADPANTNTTGTNFVNGTYLIWNISGHVTISVSDNAGPNAVVSGVFLGPTP